ASWNTLGWGSSFAHILMITGICSFILLMVRALTYVNPIIRMHLFKQKSFSVGCIILFIVGAILFGTVTTLPPLFENVLGYQKSTVGLILVSFGFVMAPTSALVGYLTKFINIRILTLVGLSCLLTSCFMQERIITVQSENWQWVMILMIRAVGVSFSLGPVTSLALQGVALPDIPAASMVVTFCRQMGGAIGASLLLLIGVYREEFHSQIYGANVNIHAPAFQAYTQAFAERFERMRGFSTTESATLAKLIVVKNVKGQAYISAVNDSFFIMGCAVTAVTILVAFIMIPVLLKMRTKAPI
ncbi:MAG: MFS transporter, partial [Chlamydiota bacterium]